MEKVEIIQGLILWVLVALYLDLTTGFGDSGFAFAVAMSIFALLFAVPIWLLGEVLYNRN